MSAQNKTEKSKFYELKKSDLFGSCDILGIFSEEEFQKLVIHFGAALNEATSRYCFISSTEKIIIPLRMLSIVMGGMYGADLPVKDKIEDFQFHPEEYKLQLYAPYEEQIH